MKTVWKSVLEIKDVQSLDIPHGAEFLSAQIQQGNLCVWYRCDPAETKVKRYFSIVGTGNDCPPDWEYISTFQIFQGDLIFHVFVQS